MQLQQKTTKNLPTLRVKKTPDFKRTIKILKGLEMLRKCKDDLPPGMKLEPFEIVCFGLPLKRLGLYLKPDYALEYDDDKEEEEWSQIDDYASREEDLCLVMIKRRRCNKRLPISSLPCK